jgi:hypothetical protein
VFSILTVRAGRVSAEPPGSGNPVNGATGLARVVVVVDDVVVAVDDGFFDLWT